MVLELNREHEYICRVRKVNLRPIGIALFDSDTLWGQFDGRTRTIFISRKLVNEYSWQQVVGVFLHEVAHQFVDEQSPKGFHSDKPHSAKFKEACRRLGVPDQYARAGLDLQNSNLDWKMEPRNEATEKILDKAKKLLSLANSTNEFEASVAMERVRELYAKYNLEHLDALSKEKFVHLVITHHKKRMESWEQRTISILTEHFFVKVLLFKQFNAKTGSHVHAVELIGTRENVLMAEYVYHFLLRQVEHLLKPAVASDRPLGRAERTSFRLGVLDGFDKKLKSSLQKKVDQATITNQAQLTVIGEALEKFRKDPYLEDYLSEIYPRLGHRRGSSFEVDDNAFAAGHAAGRSINLNKPISTSTGNQGKFLSVGKS